jgi:hypothetical protein
VAFRSGQQQNLSKHSLDQLESVESVAFGRWSIRRRRPSGEARQAPKKQAEVMLDGEPRIVCHGAEAEDTPIPPSMALNVNYAYLQAARPIETG